ncbi:hypothetical protein N0V90_006251 [Kalmusia sp. IMI 367209]|nr:hypothetical protein N0V90_006251 [Kalmusia sp. IMI 367209]
MDERESSVASSVDFYGSDRNPTTPPAEAKEDPVHTKRKAEELVPAQQKKPKLEPISYGAYVQDVSFSDPNYGSLRLLKSESIWASARNALPVKSPKPLPGFSELQMWQLVWSERCQFCQKLNSGTIGEKIWQKGPGVDGDASLLFSNASVARPALPYAFLTSDHHYIPAYMLQAATTPAGVEIAKYYYKAHVEDIGKELNEALALGSAAAEEWSKGLEARGHERMKLAENWERWEVKYRWWSDHNNIKPAAATTPPPTQTTHQEPPLSPMPHVTSPVIHAPTPASEYSVVPITTTCGSALPFLSNKSCATLTALAPAHAYMHSRPPTVPHQYTPQPGLAGNLQSSRGERNLHDANEAKATRKADIERRCQQMNPPIPPNVLRHMDSFRAAIQISQPMSDYAWSVLEPRLVAQLPAAQQAEADHVSRVSTLPKTTDRRFFEVNSKESKEIMDREWDDSQRPIRDKLSAFADDFIEQDWDGGKAVTYENSPKFAVDLLVHVRRMFYAGSANEDTTSGQGQIQPISDDGSNPNKTKLVLDSMKWVYDNKIKNLTEQFRKELFLCYGSGCEGNTKFYGFEGVIQHFGAKHTNAFSVGNVVVAWREAEWPEDTPFHPDPISVKHAFQSVSGTATHSGYGAYYGGYSRAATSTPHMQAHLPQASPGPYQYGGHYTGPFAPPQMPTTSMSGYEYGQSYGAPMDSYQYQSMAPPGYGPHPGSGYITSPAMSNPAIAPPPAGPSQVPGMSDTLHKPDEANHRTSLFDKQVSTVIDMAKDIWKHTSGIRDLPNSLRIYVLLQRVISKFHVEFNHEPNLNHFIDAFSNHEIPRALKNAPGLSCKVCQDEFSHHPRQEERKTYTVLNLFQHFKSQHSGAQASGYGNGQLPNTLDWKENMIELPSDRVISGLIHAPGMDDDKLHTVATVFPKLFPTPLPKIGKIENAEVNTPTRSLPKDLKEAANHGATSGNSIEGSGPSSLGSPYVDSPRLPKSTEDEYDPQRPALPTQASHSSRANNRRISYRGSPPSDYVHRYYAEQRYQVGQSQPSVAVLGANNCSFPQPLESGREEFDRDQGYLEYAPNPRQYREAGPIHSDYQERHPMYRDQEGYYRTTRDEVVFAHPRAGRFEQEYRPASRHVRYLEDDNRRPRHQTREEAGSLGPSPVNGKSAADRFLDEFVPGLPSNGSIDQGVPDLQAVAAEPDADDGSRYTPPPPNLIVPDEGPDPRQSNAPPLRSAPSTTSNGSRYDESRPSGRQIPTPDPNRGLRRPGPHRRRDRYHDHVPSRYFRYTGVPRDEPYSRGASMSRSQSKRYEEQRRRIDQQETPQPNADTDLTYSRDHSVEQGPIDDPPYHPRRPPQEYVSVQDRLQPYSSPRYRYASYTEEARGPPVYVDKYGQPLDEYEFIPVPRDSRPPRASYATHSQGRYVDYEPEHVQYVPVAYDRPLRRHYEAEPEYVFVEGRERVLPPRKQLYEPEATYEAPPEIKVENAPPVSDL